VSKTLRAYVPADATRRSTSDGRDERPASDWAVGPQAIHTGPCSYLLKKYALARGLRDQAIACTVAGLAYEITPRWYWVPF
jgi:hypothetical protein